MKRWDSHHDLGLIPVGKNKGTVDEINPISPILCKSIHHLGHMDFLEKEYGRRLNSAVNFGLRRKGVVSGSGGGQNKRNAVDVQITRF